MGQHRALVEVEDGRAERYAERMSRAHVCEPRDLGGVVFRDSSVTREVAIPPVRAKVRQRVTKQVTRQETKKARGKRDRLGRAKGWVAPAAPRPTRYSPGQYLSAVKVGEWRYVNHGEAQSSSPMLIARMSSSGLISCVKPNMFVGRSPRDRRAGWCAGFVNVTIEDVSIPRVPARVVTAIIAEIGRPPHVIGGGK